MRAVLIAAFVVGAAGFQQGPPQNPPASTPLPGRPATTPPPQVPADTGDRVLSASVWASWITHRTDTGAHRLDVLILWRGKPGWWQAPPPAPLGTLTMGPPGARPGAPPVSGAGPLRSGGPTPTPASLTLKRQLITRGGLRFTIAFDVVSRALTIQDKDAALGDGNVLFVDSVDGADGFQIGRSLKVDPAMPASTRIDVIIQRSPDAIAYLRCDTKLADAKTQAMLDGVCAQVSGKYLSHMKQ